MALEIIGKSLCLPTGMIHAGVGETHVNEILMSVDVPPICHKLMKWKEGRLALP